MKTEYIYILCHKDFKSYKIKVKARVFEKEGIKFAIIGNSREGFNLTLVSCGMSIIYASKMKELLNNLDDIIFKIKNIPQAFFENAIKQYNEAEIKEGE